MVLREIGEADFAPRGRLLALRPNGQREEPPPTKQKLQQGARKSIFEVLASQTLIRREGLPSRGEFSAACAENSFKRTTR